MKHILAALAFCAAPATAFAQSVSCQSCDHVASYFRGAGGFIGTVADGADEVAFVASCGGVTVTGPAQIHGETASQWFSHRNGLACDQEGGSLEIAGLRDGGWYWIHDDVNSAVGNLVAKGILMNEKVELTPAGPLELDVDLWVDESGSYNTGDLTSTPALANRGWAGKGTDNWLGNVGWFAGLSGGGPGSDLAGAAVTIADNDSDGQATISISPSATYCPPTGTQTTATVRVLAFGSGATVPDTVHGGGTATTGSSDADTIFPPLATQRSLGGYSSTTIRVACPPSAAANLGQEPVPGNPFPTDGKGNSRAASVGRDRLASSAGGKP